MPKFSFEVDFGPGLKGVVFQEVSGLDAEPSIIEYRKGNSAVFSPVKMPNIQKFGNVTMKKGVFAGDKALWDWYSEIKMNTIKRQTILIRLLDESGGVTMQWKLDNAWPVKITTTDLKKDGNEVAIESLEIAHEGLTIANR